MFIVFPYFPITPTYDIEIIANLLGKNNPDYNFLLDLNDTKKKFTRCLESYNGNNYEEYLNKNGTEFLLMLDLNEKLKDIILKNISNLKMTSIFNFNYTFGKTEVSDITSMINGDIILSRIAFGMINNWKFIKQINNFMNLFIEKKQLDTSILTKIKDSFYEGVIRLYVLRENGKDIYYPKLGELSKYSELSLPFLEFLLNIYESNLLFFVIFNKINSTNVKEIVTFLTLLQTGLKKISNAINYCNECSFNFKNHLLNYLIMLNLFFEMIYGYYKMREYECYIKVASYPDDLTYDKTVFYRYLFAMRSKSVYEEFKSIEKNVNDIFNLKINFKFVIVFYEFYLLDEEKDSITMYQNVEKKLKGLDKSTSTIKIILSYKPGEDLIKKALETKSSGLKL